MFKKHALKTFVFLFNLTAAALGVFLIKNQADKNNQPVTEKTVENVPIDEVVMNAQSSIVSDREQKLRDLNTSPKALTKTNTTTTTTTTTTQPTTTKTKTS